MTMTREQAEAAVRTLLEFIGDDPSREGIRDTPRRVVDALVEMTRGEAETAEAHLGVTFASPAYDEIVLLRDIPFTSLCEHHLLPFSGVAHVAYLPAPWMGKGYRVVGLSKLARTVDVFAHRLQLQEQMTSQIADALEKHLHPRAVVVRVEAEHSCMACRGVRKTGSTMVTQSVRGLASTDAVFRAEVFALMGHR